MMNKKFLVVMIVCVMQNSWLFGGDKEEKSIKNMNITYYTQQVAMPERCILVCDIGGTNTRCALFEVGKNKQSIVFNLRVLTHDIVAFTDVILQTLAIARQKYNIIVTKAVCAVAGCPTKNTDVWMLPNVAWNIGKKEILQKTSITNVVLLNDFEAIGYSLEVLAEQDLVRLNSGTISKQENKVVLGAGTGLGKCIAAWNPIVKNYLVVQAQGAHADFPIHNLKEFGLINFLQNKHSFHVPVSYEDFLSGRGIVDIYTFLEQTGMYAKTEYSFTIQKHNYDPVIIAQYKNIDACCKKTFELFAAFYGRAAKNFAIEAGAFGGVYLAGGIAAKNLDMFHNGCFMAEFLNNAIFKELLEQTPVYIITNQDAGLLGAARFAGLCFD